MNRIPGIRLPDPEIAIIATMSKTIRQVASSKRLAAYQLKITRIRRGMTENTPRTPTFARITR